MNWHKHEFKIGDRVQLKEDAPYDGTTPGTKGTVVALTTDSGVVAYSVEFDDGVSETHLYIDEIEGAK